MRSNVTTFQIGKNGATNGVIDSLALDLKHHKQVRVSILKGSERDREKMQEIALDIQKRLRVKCDYKIIGFTIILIKRKKFRNNRLF